MLSKFFSKLERHRGRALLAAGLLCGLAGLSALRAADPVIVPPAFGAGPTNDGTSPVTPPPSSPPAAPMVMPRNPDSLPADSLRLNPRVRAVAKVLPSVVNISTERVVAQSYSKYDPYDPFAELFNQFLGLQEPYKTTSSLGSGVIVEASGLVVTNEHVIRKASRIIVYLSDGSSYDAMPVAIDISNDLALLRLEGLEADRRLVAIPFARPDDLLLGEDVIAVGNPYGLGHSVSTGVLSAIGRKFTYKGKVIFDDILQTDAAINPGNSGGPLVNADGQLIGLSLAIQRDAEGIGFAIPVKRLEEILGVWLLPSRFGLNLLGIVPGTKVLPENHCQAYIREVRLESPAGKAGLQPGMIVTAVNGWARRSKSVASCGGARPASR
jgi:serine protease Do